MKSEPDVYGWDDLEKEGTGVWDGVRSHQAKNNLAAMEVGDQAFFYHSNIGREIVGIVEVCAAAHPDSTTDDDRWDCVDIRAVEPLPQPVTLDTIKSDPALSDMVLVKNSRLSVQPVSEAEWRHICGLGGL